jgi:hypothetical protein
MIFENHSVKILHSVVQWQNAEICNEYKHLSFPSDLISLS